MAPILLKQLMINPNEFNFVTVHCCMPSGVISGALVQFFTYLQNLNFKEVFIDRLSGALNGLTSGLCFKHFAKWTAQHKGALLRQPSQPSELHHHPRSNDKKDSLTW